LVVAINFARDAPEKSFGKIGRKDVTLMPRNVMMRTLDPTRFIATRETRISPPTPERVNQHLQFQSNLALLSFNLQFSQSPPFPLSCSLLCSKRIVLLTSFKMSAGDEVSLSPSRKRPAPEDNASSSALPNKLHKTNSADDVHTPTKAMSIQSMSPLSSVNTAPSTVTQPHPFTGSPVNQVTAGASSTPSKAGSGADQKRKRRTREEIEREKAQKDAERAAREAEKEEKRKKKEAEDKIKEEERAKKQAEKDKKKKEKEEQQKAKDEEKRRKEEEKEKKARVCNMTSKLDIQDADELQSQLKLANFFAAQSTKKVPSTESPKKENSNISSSMLILITQH